MPLTSEQVAQGVLLIEQGLSQREAAARLNISRSTLQYALQRHRETGLYTRRHGSGRLRSTSSRDDRFIALQVLRNRFLTAVEITTRLRLIRNVTVSERTVRRRIEERNLRARRPARGPALLRRHRVARLRFARLHVNWTIRQWSNVLFVDESRVALRAPDGRERVWRRRGERFLPITTRQVAPFHGGSIMIWGGICLRARTELVLVNGNMTAARYITEILEDHVMPFVEFIGNQDFLLMHDNARPHTATSVLRYLAEVGIQKVEWPAHSPDLNPIEHIWDNLKRKIRASSNPPETLDELRIAILRTWEEIPQQDIRDLIVSMRSRCQAVIRARGGNTRY